MIYRVGVIYIYLYLCA